MNLNWSKSDYSWENRGKTKSIDIYDNSLCFNSTTYTWEKSDLSIDNDNDNDNDIDISPIVFIPSNMLIDNYWHFTVETLIMIAYVYKTYDLPLSSRILIDTSHQPKQYKYGNMNITNVNNIVGIDLLKYFSNNKLIFINSEEKSGIRENIYTNKLIRGTGGLHEPLFNFNSNKYIETWFYLRNKIMTYLDIKEETNKTYNILLLSRESAINKHIINNTEFLNAINNLLVNTKYNLIIKDFAKITVKEQIEVVNNCDIFICSRGAGNINAIFMKKNAVMLFCAPLRPSLDHHPSINVIVPIIPNQYDIISNDCIINWGNWKHNEYNVNNVINGLQYIISKINI